MLLLLAFYLPSPSLPISNADTQTEQGAVRSTSTTFTSFSTPLTLTEAIESPSVGECALRDRLGVLQVGVLKVLFVFSVPLHFQELNTFTVLTLY